MRGGERCARMKSFESKTKVAFIVALALTGITLVFCCLAVIAGAEQKCVGRQWHEGYRPIDFFGLLLVAVFIAAIIGRVALGSRLWRGTLFKVNGMTMKFENLGYGSVIGALMSLVNILGVSIVHWDRIITECLSQS
jgi:hypothetical protein